MGLKLGQINLRTNLTTAITWLNGARLLESLKVTNVGVLTILLCKIMTSARKDEKIRRCAKYGIVSVVEDTIVSNNLPIVSALQQIDITTNLCKAKDYPSDPLQPDPMYYLVPMECGICILSNFLSLIVLNSYFSGVLTNVNSPSVPIFSLLTENLMCIE